MLNKGLDTFSLYIKRGSKFMLYGTGSLRYIRELLYDYLVKNDLYGKDEVEFKIKRR